MNNIHKKISFLSYFKLKLLYNKFQKIFKKMILGDTNIKILKIIK